MLTLVKIGWQEAPGSERMKIVLTEALNNKKYTTMERVPDFTAWLQQPAQIRKETKFIFAVSLGTGALNAAYIDWLNCFLNNPDCLAECTGVVVVDGSGELFTKKIGRELIFVANRAGCAFPGQPLIEATGSLYNFTIRAQLQGLDNMAAYQKAVKDLVEKLVVFSAASSELPKINDKRPKKKIAVIHASIYKTSNTILLWNLVKKQLGDKAEIEEISLRNGEVIDCRGCNYETCLHFGEQGSCFYGGVIVEKVYPAISHSDDIVLLCPNYNDAVSANLTAFINRLTALFRKKFAMFAHKKIFALVVSGYSGGDIVAEQIIDAMNCNKNFILPGKFALVETANAPQSILQCQGIEQRALLMAERLLQ
jgi:multimeric flavodoxin WrbA